MVAFCIFKKHPGAVVVSRNSAGRVLWFVVVCCGLLWFVVVCCGLLWFVVVCCGFHQFYLANLLNICGSSFLIFLTFLFGRQKEK